MFEELLSHGELPVIIGLGGIIIANILAFFIMGADGSRRKDDGWHRRSAPISDAGRKGPDEHGRRA